MAKSTWLDSIIFSFEAGQFEEVAYAGLDAFVDRLGRAPSRLLCHCPDLTFDPGYKTTGLISIRARSTR